MERRKYMGRAYKDFYKTFTSKIIRVDVENIKGCASYVHIIEVNRPFVAGSEGNEICLTDNGYSELTFQPDAENWRLTAIYDNHGGIVEYYFDISRKNTVDEEGKPYCDDLFLDAALMPDGRVLILDEDELNNALTRGDISRNDFYMAHQILRDLINSKMFDLGYLKSLCAKLFSAFDMNGPLTSSN